MDSNLKEKKKDLPEKYQKTNMIEIGPKSRRVEEPGEERQC